MFLRRAGRYLPFGMVAFMYASAAWAADCSPDRISIRGDWGQAAFTIEVADDPNERAQGLMHRESMPTTHGMLFVFDAPQRASFWMKNTLIPLDMIFVQSDGTVSHVHHNAIPHDTTPIDGGTGVYAVLEVNGGLAKRFGIAEGSELQHPAFDPATAAWACEGANPD